MTKTLFAPYRHDAVDMNRLPIRFWGQAMLNNLVSRSVGFVLRLGVIMAGVVSIVVVGIGSIIFTVMWFCLPVLLLASIIYGIVLLAGSGI